MRQFKKEKVSGVYKKVGPERTSELLACVLASDKVGVGSLCTTCLKRVLAGDIFVLFVTF